MKAMQPANVAAVVQVGFGRPFFRRQRARRTVYPPAWSPFKRNESQPFVQVEGRQAVGVKAERDSPAAHPDAVDPLYLFGCHVEWERRGEPSSAWEIVAAARSAHGETSAHAKALLARSHPVKVQTADELPITIRRKRSASVEDTLKTRHGLEMIESCTECSCRRPNFFCSFSGPALKCLEAASHHTTLPAGAILFVEGQMPRGIFVLCSGRVKLSTASREGKVLILKFAEAGEELGLSAAISGMNYEMTAETATPCQLNYLDRQSLLNLIEAYSEVGMHAARSLSRDFQFAYRDMHDLVLARSSTGKLARLLLSSCSEEPATRPEEGRVRSGMTHEEMAQRIGASRETVTRLLSDLKKRQLLRVDGSTLVIRDRPALEALAV